MTASAYPMLVLVPARTAHEKAPLFLEPLGDGTLLDRTLYDAERRREQGEVALALTTDDERLVHHVAARGGDWLTRLREQGEAEAGYFYALEAACDWAAKEAGKDFASVLVLEPSHPFRPTGLIANAIDIFERAPDLDTVVAVVREYGNLWTDDARGGLTRMKTPEGRTFFREIAGLCLLTRPASLTRNSAMGQNVGFVVVEEQWALIDIHGRDGVALAHRFHDFLTGPDA